MTTMIFDTLDFAERAQKAGFTREQAEFQAREIAHGIEHKLATKQDLSTLRDQLIIRFGAMLGVAIAILAAIIKLT